jgi:peptidoglycan/xylan/chitin deacetylase (PgdA/CDA1 family)
MNTFRTVIKRAVETALLSGGVATVVRRIHAEAPLILAYHNVVPTGACVSGDRPLHLPQRAFSDQLDTLLETHDIVSLTDVLSPATPRRPRYGMRPRAAITFDDAYSGALTAGLDELRARSLPATVFVTPSFLDGASFWWDVLADPSTGLDAGLRAHVLLQGRGIKSNAIAIARGFGVPIQSIESHARGASVSELDSALAYEQLTLGAHTWSHPNLTTASNDELVVELRRPIEWLERFGTRALPMISYPYGLADDRVQRAARDAGYVAGFMIDGNWTAGVPPPQFAIPRLNVPAGVSRDGFALRAAGVIQG